MLYLNFISKYPQYGLSPYTEALVTGWLEVVELLYPQISTCLPENSKLLATRYALEHQNLLEDCDYQGNIREYSSRNDTAVYVSSKTTFALRSTLPGRNLYQLFRVHGCYTKQTGINKEKCC